ncbi:MAG TPA: cytochrome c peroxidase [Candidatus Eisenbacteria bacterium]|nr:cytochrome c peroxidase [Candidatus Eisenbacteria bacterium]
MQPQPTPLRISIGVLILTPVLAILLSAARAPDPVDRELQEVLRSHGFTGSVERSLTKRLGRPVDRRLADLGRLLWFDTVTGLNDDNSCAGCHSPTHGFGDTQSIAIGVENNGIVGPGRTGPRNQRRAPLVINNAFYPNLMWNSRFAALSGDPFDNSQGFRFPEPEGMTLSKHAHLLVAQAFIPPTERNEVAGFTFEGGNTEIRDEVLRRLNAIPEYRTLFGRVFPEVRDGAPITFDHFGQAIAEFEFSLTFANAPIDRFARGESDAMTPAMKRGALLFFGRARCASCHAVSGRSNEMFSDFETHVIAVPQVAPAVTNSVFDGPGKNEDFGLEQVTGNPEDRYEFRTSPLRNIAVQPTFCHNGAFTSIEEVVRHHCETASAARAYRPDRLAEDLRGPVGPIEPVLERLDPVMAAVPPMEGQDLSDLVAFVGQGLLDPRAEFRHLRRLIPSRVPSGRPVLTFEAPENQGRMLAGATAPGQGTHVRRAGSLRLRGAASEPSGLVAVRFDLARPAEVRARVYDVAGRLVRTLDGAGSLPTGSHTLRWDGTSGGGVRAARGVYWIEVQAGLDLARQRVLSLR